MNDDDVAKLMTEAATKIRTVAQATPHAEHGWFHHGDGIVSAGDTSIVCVAEGRRVDDTVATHIGLWDPLIAEKLAGILDLWATNFDNRHWQNERPGIRTRLLGYSPMEEAVIALADAILGTD